MVCRLVLGVDTLIGATNEEGEERKLNCLSRFLHLSHYVIGLRTSGEGRDEDPLREARSERRSLESSLGDERDGHGDDQSRVLFDGKGSWTVVNRDENWLTVGFG